MSFAASQLDFFDSDYGAYSSNGFLVDYSQIPSPSSSVTSSGSSHYGNTPPPIDYYSIQQNNYVSRQVEQNYPASRPMPIQVPQLPMQTPQIYPSRSSAAAGPVSGVRVSKPRSGKVVAHPRQPHIPHPYARLFAKKDEVKRRKIWNHVHEKSIFSPFELSTVGAPQRRTVYIASLEAHIDRLHARLLDLGFWPVNFSELEPFKGLNSKTAKSMVAGLQHDSSLAKLKLLELERANGDLTKTLSSYSSGK
ncbi:hypothetical protein CPB83DRAFT_881131 [Crepidotus variabilis]|uniref:Uncharacterized protein n=1 Tax=Crepidotus variabilis TaxID=179855 RepID=A0A9P6EMV4_9AGAR|nr:hypothetical protein CPB83DRAFT_881131 [Crepidotus variabilis]